jgi:hypothetical protein
MPKNTGKKRMPTTDSMEHDLNSYSSNFKPPISPSQSMQ